MLFHNFTLRKGLFMNWRSLSPDGCHEKIVILNRIQEKPACHKPAATSVAEAFIYRHKSHPGRVGMLAQQFESLVGKQLY